MGRGGARIGAGRKPGSKNRPKAIVLALRGGHRLPQDVAPEPPVVDVAPAGLAIPPADLPVAEQAFWARYAPIAIEQRTLVEATVAGFRELSEQFVIKDEMIKHIHVLGATSAEADRLVKRYEKLAQRVDASLKAFKLTAFGKPVEGAKPRQAAVNPWAALG
jgi:hypothetical protein